MITILFFLINAAATEDPTAKYCADYKQMYSMQYEATVMRQDAILSYKDVYAMLRQEDFYRDLKHEKTDEKIKPVLDKYKTEYAKLKPAEKINPVAMKKVQMRTGLHGVFKPGGLVFHAVASGSDEEEQLALKAVYTRIFKFDQKDNTDFLHQIVFSVTPPVFALPVVVTYSDYSGRSLTRALDFNYTFNTGLTVTQKSLELKEKSILQNQHVARQLVSYGKIECIAFLGMGEFVPDDLMAKVEAYKKIKTKTETKTPNTKTKPKTPLAQ